MLARVGLLRSDEDVASRPGRARPRSARSSPTARSCSLPTDEDIHTAVERRVTELAGPAGAKLHTGRSRNDQVATDLRLYLRREGQGGRAPRSHALQEVLVAPGDRGRRRHLPPRLHAPAARPARPPRASSAGPLLGASARDVDRWRDALARADVSPLGAGALAGSSLPLDPDVTSPTTSGSRTGSRTRSTRSPTATSSPRRCSSLALTQVAPLAHRRGDRAVVERGVRLRPPRRRVQHRLVDAARRRRTPTSPSSRAARPAASSATSPGCSRRSKGLPLAYNRDLQEDKEPLFDALDTCALALAALTGLLETRRVRPRRGCGPRPTRRRRRRPTSPRRSSAQGLPFREAHAAVGALVRQAVERGVGARGAGHDRPAPRPRRARAARAGSGRPPAHDARAAPAPNPSRCSSTPPVPGSREQARLARRTVSRPRGVGGRSPRRSTPATPASSRRGLLNKLARARRPGVPGGSPSGIVEVEAYAGAEDPGSHAYRGTTRATRRCSARPGTSTCTSPTGCTGA